MYVANTNPLNNFSFAKHPKEKEKQGFPNQTNKRLIIA
jgi:hypothetical protein